MSVSDKITFALNMP